MSEATTAVLAIWALAIAGTDLRQLRVPNSLLLLVFVPAVLIQFLNGCGLLAVGPIDAVIGLGLGLGLGLPGYMARQFGAGDVKYMAVLGLLCGWRGILTILLVAALMLGLLSVISFVHARIQQRKSGRLPAAVALTSGFLFFLFLSRKFDHGF